MHHGLSKEFNYFFKKSAIDSTCAVWGNISITPALLSVNPKSIKREVSLAKVDGLHDT